VKSAGSDRRAAHTLQHQRRRRTWKLGLNWRMNDDWRFRAPRRETFVRPIWYELYRPGGQHRQLHRFRGNESAPLRPASCSACSIRYEPEAGSRRYHDGRLHILAARLPGFSVKLDATIKMKDTIVQFRGHRSSGNRRVPEQRRQLALLQLVCSRHSHQLPTQILGYLLNVASQDT